jgi:hypothetical protein
MQCQSLQGRVDNDYSHTLNSHIQEPVSLVTYPAESWPSDTYDKSSCRRRPFADVQAVADYAQLLEPHTGHQGQQPSPWQEAARHETEMEGPSAGGEKTHRSEALDVFVHCRDSWPSLAGSGVGGFSASLR